MKLNIKNLSKKYGDLQVIENVSLALENQEILCVLGPSGCGKSTILRIISGLEANFHGQINRSFEKLSYVFQEDRLLEWFSVIENISIVNPEVTDIELSQLLKQMSLQGFEKSKPCELSGGMRQRVSIARAFNHGGDVLLMDEPLKSLDYDLKFDLIASILKVHRKLRGSIIYVTHDIDEAILLGDRILILDSRPSEVINEIKLESVQESRFLGNEESMQIRAEIINSLVKR